MIVRLHAPMAGWAMPLDEVPDPVSADGMMGAGLAIDPLDGVVRAPGDTIADVALAAAPETASDAGGDTARYPTGLADRPAQVSTVRRSAATSPNASPA